MVEATEAKRETAPGQVLDGTSVTMFLARNGILVALVVLMAFFALTTDIFLTWANLQLILLQSAIVAIVAVPSAILLLSGYVDFSVGSTLGLSAVILGQLLGAGYSIPVACALALAVALLVGAVSGYLSTYLEFSPIVVTLGMFAAVRGLALVVSAGKSTSGFGNTFALIGRGRVIGLDVPVPVVIAAVVFLLGAIFLYKTARGRHVLALGSNVEASYQVGININLLPMLLYMATSLSAGLGAIVLVSRLDAAPPTIGENLEMSVLTAVLLGGVAFGGGRGSLTGVAAGVVFIGVMHNGLLLLGVPPFWLRVSSGVALVVAASLDAFTTRFLARRSGVAVGGRVSRPMEVGKRR